MSFRLHPEAESDLRGAASYYRDHAGLALAQAFLAEFERSMGLLVQHPLLGASWRHGKRRLVMKHFPYAVIYAITDHEIQVLAVAHHSRHPGYWRRRRL